MKWLKIEPTFKNVNGVEIGIMVSFIILLWFFFCRMNGGGWINGQSLVNGDGASRILDVSSFVGWSQYQFNSLGSRSGALQGESN